jgi:hypothetical protein
VRLTFELRRPDPRPTGRRMPLGQCLTVHPELTPQVRVQIHPPATHVLDRILHETQATGASLMGLRASFDGSPRRSHCTLARVVS